MRLNEARNVLNDIVSKASEDPNYKERLQRDTLNTLVDEGLPYDVIDDFLQETGLEPGTHGYAVLEDCANSCALTGKSAYPNGF